jgi:PadR family transcriptional regulator AphA
MVTSIPSPSSRASASKFALLGMLTLKPMSGYELRNLISESIGYFWSESYGQIYPTLKQLEHEALIQKHSAAAPTSGRESQPYAITEAGREALRRWLDIPPYSAPPRSELLLKIFFAPEADLNSIRRHVADVREQAVREVTQYAKVEESLRKHRAGHPGFPFWVMTIRFGQKRSEAMLEWCDETTAELETLLRKKSTRSTHTRNSRKTKE